MTRSAIIDIGYNAIRAVVYKDETLGAPEIFSTKFKNDILHLLKKESLDTKHQTYLVISYLLRIFDRLNVTKIKCVATAVLRAHTRAEDFVQHIKNEYKFDIDVISGKDEAKFTALGITTTIADTNGMVVDLGGGSLELVVLEKGKITDIKSFELGTKVISSKNITNENEIVEIINKYYDNKKYDNLYLACGALRFIGKLYIHSIKFPLKNLHNFEIDIRDFSNYLNKLQSSGKKFRDRFEFKKQVNQNAILIAKALLSIFQPKKIIISTYGLKEGVRFTQMDENEKKKDIIIEKIRYMCNFDVQTVEWQSYFDIVGSFFPKNVPYEMLTKLSIIFASMQDKFDLNLYTNAISEFILSSEVPLPTKTRIMLALVLSYKMNYKSDIELMRMSRMILHNNDINNCKIIGNILSIAEIIDGPVFYRPSFSININGNFLEIVTDDILPRTIFEKVSYYLKSIAFARRSDSNSNSILNDYNK